MESKVTKRAARIIAYYLPQFHPIPENDEWWGTGFTEWTNVGKAKPLFRGHDQPKVPANLGYYDLRIPEVREQQAKMAKEAGVEGFCYWHYWFGNGKRLLERPFNEVLNNGNPDFSFCLGWANESWKAKLWNNDSSEDRTLIEQKYPGIEDFTDHFYTVLSAFKDSRYIRVNNKPLFLIYRPFNFGDINLFIKLWNDLALENGLEGIHFVAQVKSFGEYDMAIKKGFNAITVAPTVRIDFTKPKSTFKYQLSRILKVIRQRPWVINYAKAFPHFVNKNEDSLFNVIPSIIPNWDHSPRSGKRATVLHNSTPDLFDSHVKDVLNIVKDKPEEERIVFLKSWNEWAEGNYIEPDLKHGTSYLDILKKNIYK